MDEHPRMMLCKTCKKLWNVSKVGKRPQEYVCPRCWGIKNGGTAQSYKSASFDPKTGRFRFTERTQER